MPAIDLATLNATELRQLLRLARGNHDGPLIDQIEWELAERASLSTRLGVDVDAPVIAGRAPGANGSEPVEPGLRLDREPRSRPQLYALRRRPPSGGLGWGAAGLVAGAFLTTAVFWTNHDLAAWRLSVRLEPSATEIKTTEGAAPPPVRAEAAPPPAAALVETAAAGPGSDAVAGVLAPHPFPARPEPPPPPPAPTAPAPAPEPEVPPPPPPPSAVELAEAEPAPPPKAAPPPRKVVAAKARTAKVQLAARKPSKVEAKKVQLAAAEAKAKPSARRAPVAKLAAATERPKAKTPTPPKTQLAAKTPPKAKPAAASKVELAVKTPPKRPTHAHDGDDPIAVILANAGRSSAGSGP
jgi:hypothetical protein